ncbi:MAG: protein BmrU [Pirellulales bacterium]|nr:protein BmrU [Pirellulales bacterium]
MSERQTLSPDAREVLISVNPTAGVGAMDVEVKRLVELLGARDFNAQVLTDLDEVSAQANQMHRDGTLRALVGVGGDGTAAELVNRTEPGVPITMLPGGTENLLARYLQLRRSADALAEIIAAGRFIRLDAGRAGERLFLLMIGCGFDAEVVRRLEEQRTGHIGHYSYARPIVETVAHYEYPKMVIYSSDSEARQQPSESLPSSACWIFAFNLPCYAWGFRFAPEATGTDGLLDVCTFRRGTRWHGLRYFSALVLRRHRRLADCRFFRSGRLRIEAEAKVPYQLDGDFAGYLPVEVEVVPRRLTFVVPSDTAERLGE